MQGVGEAVLGERVAPQSRDPATERIEGRQLVKEHVNSVDHLADLVLPPKS